MNDGEIFENGANCEIYFKGRHMLIGEHKSKIGPKRRVAIPNKVRSELKKGTLILTRGYENSLVIVNKNMWENLSKEIVQGSFINKNIRDISRFLVGSAVEIEYDAQGRFIIPEPLAQYANLKTEVTFVGLMNWVEIWSSESWEERIKYVSANSDEISEQLVNSSMKENE